MDAGALRSCSTFLPAVPILEGLLGPYGVVKPLTGAPQCPVVAESRVPRGRLAPFGVATLRPEGEGNFLLFLGLFAPAPQNH